MKAERKLIALLAVAALVSIVNASVFVYYPINLTISPQKPPIIFLLGNNADKDDLYGNNKIEVSTGNANTLLTITVHPTYQTNYYRNITVIKNQDSKAYYFKIRVTDAFTDTKITNAKLRIYNSDRSIDEWVDLKSTGDTPSDSWLGPLNADERWFVDINITISEYEGSSPDSAPSLVDNSASLQLIYSPQNVESAAP
jgi:hypothetical protein